MAGTSALIAGINGGFGKLFSGLLAAEGCRVLGTDLAPSPDPGPVCAQYFRGDITRPGEELSGAIRAAAIVLLCVPEEAALHAAGLLLKSIGAGGLLVDTLSVKTGIAAVIANEAGNLEALSLNPLFSPDVGFAGQNVAAVPIRNGPRSQELLRWISGWGARVVCMTAEEHDRRAAAVQAATHAAILSFGICLGRMQYTPDAVFSTPPHRALLALVARISSRDPEVYRRIQTDNPFAAAARLELSRAVSEFSQQLDPDEFRAMFASIRRTLGPALDEGLSNFQRMLS